MRESKAEWIDENCKACGGTGSVTEMTTVRPLQPKINPPKCPVCDGTGRVKAQKP